MAAMNKKVLVAPLDWGLGHATRCVPVIHEFLSQGCEVQIASSGDALVLLKEEFPDLKFHSIVSYRAEYSSTIPFMVKILLQMPKFLSAIKREHTETEAIIEREKIDFVISDNRYGCWSDKKPSILITHQVNILMSARWRWLEWLINFGNHSRIRKFTACWVPDVPDGITGKMTAASTMRLTHIGMLSRFEKQKAKMTYDVLAIVSGPEPQRSLLEEKLKRQLKQSGRNYFIVRGKPSERMSPGAHQIDHANASQLNKLIESSQIIIARSGYTTVMDLWKLGKHAIFIPTPGQTEQEYLASELKRKGVAFSQHQREFDLQQCLLESKGYRGFESFPSSPNLLAIAVNQLLNNSSL